MSCETVRTAKHVSNPVQSTLHHFAKKRSVQLQSDRCNTKVGPRLYSPIQVSSYDT